MDKRFVIIRGKEYRIEVNWNAFEEFARLKGATITDALSLSLQEGDNIKVMMTAAIKEGERLEGREFTMTPVEVGEILTPVAVSQFLAVYREQYIGEEGARQDSLEEGKGAKKKPGPTGS